MKHLDPKSNKLIIQYTELDPSGLRLDVIMYVGHRKRSYPSYVIIVYGYHVSYETRATSPH